MTYFSFSRDERITATWHIEAETLEQAIRAWNNPDQPGVSLISEEVIEIDGTYWHGPDGEFLEDEVEQANADYAN